MPDLPGGPFYTATPRGDDPPVPPMSDGSLEGMDGTGAGRGAVTPAGYRPGMATGERRHLRSRPEDVGEPWPCRVFELADVVNLRWEATVPGSFGLRGDALRAATERFERSGGLSKPGVHRWLTADSGVIVRELPGWRYFGPFGERVPGILEEVWGLNPGLVAALPDPPARAASDPLERITIPVLPAPDGELARAGSNARAAVVHFFESRSWASNAGGGFYYRGCCSTWIVSDPRWLAAMGLALNAVTAAVSGPAIDPLVRSRALDAWRELAGR